MDSSWLGMIPLALFTLFGVMYHIGHVEYDKHQQEKNNNTQHKS